MNLFILRHASAGIRRVNPLLDVKRPLDKEGKRHCLQLAHVLNALKIQFDLVVSSPLKRSLQTASLVSNETGYESQILLSKSLAPEASLQDFHRLLSDCRDYENVLVVGHNPNLTLFLSSLLVPASAAVNPQVRLRKGTIARLSYSRSPATLTWLLDSRTVRALYATSTKSSRRKISRK
ncbi:SixA phosphatase family protein [Edaphobacter bradus]|uniref:SixA phosphatase family protein n=1 Tax=Edaphobacter bradus TaxID=2259016 RepID=UPI0021DF9085|nr:histidine phosphatase family protein [Edaphobacter bradus]